MADPAAVKIYGLKSLMECKYKGSYCGSTVATKGL